MDLKEIQNIVKNVMYKKSLTRTEIVTFDGAPIAMNTRMHGGVVAYKRWRVVAVGFGVTSSGVETQDPGVHFGVLLSDIAASDTDYFGKVVQSGDPASHLIAGDMWMRDTESFLGTPDAIPADEASPPEWNLGSGHLMEWQTKAAMLTVTRPNDHALSVVPFMLLEVQD